MKKILLSFMLLLMMMGVVCGQDSNQVRQFICTLASPEFHGRGYAYNGDSIAAEYLRAQLQALDVEPFVKDYYHKYGFNVYAMEGPVKAALNGEKLRPWEDFALAPFSHSADEMFLLLPIKPEDILNPDKLLGFCQKNSAKLSKSLLFVDMTKCKDKEMVNDLGTVFRHLYMYNGQLPFRGFVAAVKDIPVWSFNIAQQESDYVMAYIHPRKVKKHSVMSLSYSNELAYHPTQNVCGMVRGTVAPDSLVLVCGHYDHLGQMGESVIFPGAHDNASGASTVLDMAAHYRQHPPRYTTVFVLFSGEEAGLMGSLAFVKDSLFDFSKVKMVLNIDLMCGGDDGIMMVNATGDNTHHFYDAMVAYNNEAHCVKEVKSRSNAANIDHYPFTMKGMPAVFIYTLGGRNGGYHDPYDVCDKCGLEPYEGIVHLLIHSLDALR